MRQKSLVVLTLLICAQAQAVEPKEKKDSSDQAIYSIAVAKARMARITEIEASLADLKESRGSADPREVALAKAELKWLKSKKKTTAAWEAEHLRIDILHPVVGQIGVLAWGKLNSDARRPKFVADSVVSPTSLIAVAQWKTEQHAVASSYSNPTAGGFAPSVKLGETIHEGPRLLITSVPASGYKPGDTINLLGVFIVEPSSGREGDADYTLRRLSLRGR